MAVDPDTVSDVPSENVLPSTDSAPSDRRTRKRDQRRTQLLDLAADIVSDAGIEGLTMAALAEAGDYATASLYTYFPSRSALIAALQQRALHTLGAVANDAVAQWDTAIVALDPAPSAQVASLARLVAFGDLFLQAPTRHPHEFQLQQRLLVERNAQDTSDAATVVPAAMAVLHVPRQLLVDAVDVSALSAPDTVLDPLGQPLDAALLRTLAWIVALNGALLTDHLATGLPTTGAVIGRELTASLLAGWGADAEDLASARSVAARWDDTPSTHDHLDRELR